jgi:hypothetical protein
MNEQEITESKHRSKVKKAEARLAKAEAALEAAKANSDQQSRRDGAKLRHLQKAIRTAIKALARVQAETLARGAPGFLRRGSHVRARKRA